MNGIVFDIKRFAVHDGPGIRTTVFLKGCPLACTWCHNPESINRNIETVKKNVRIGNKSFEDIETVGRVITTEELMTELRKERVFMEESGGGVTFSGGEPLLQPAFLLQSLAACKEESMHTALDTSGLAALETLRKVADYTDLFLYDIKLMDAQLHLQYTGVKNNTILENLTSLLQDNKNVRIRIPIIPNISFTMNNIRQIIVFLLNQSSSVQGVDLLPFHRTAMHKYERFGILNAFKDENSIQKNELWEVQNEFEKYGFEVKIGG